MKPPIGGMLLLMVAASTLAAGGRPRPAAQAGVTAAAPLGTVITTTVNVDNTGQTAATALLYEAWAPAAAGAFMPAAPLRVPLPDEPGPISPALTQALAELGTTDFIIYLAEQADLSSAAAIHDWNARGAAVVETLRAQAAETQAGLLADLRARGYQPKPFWIVNAIVVRGDADLAQWAASRPGVALVAANTVHALETPTLAPAVEASGIAWGVEKVEAPSTWADWGVRGQGITVATIDTGAAYTHTALLANYRGNSGATLDHNYHWFDAAGEPAAAAPVDGTGHGTHVLGSLVGRAAGDYTALGVAPDARWIAVRGCGGAFCSDTALIASAQWLLAPTDLGGKNPRPDLRPHIINNSWGKAGADDWYLGYVEAWNAAGIFSVFANGNAGTALSCGSSTTPGSYAAAFAVGATDEEDFVADFSSRGPTADDRVKPDLSAPGVAIPSAWPTGGTHTLSGTSMAAPHVAGAAALLWSANPALVGDLAATRAALTGSALPRTSAECGPSATAVPNNTYGWGRLDVHAAIGAARVDVPWLSVPASLALPAGGQAQAALTLDARQVTAPGTYLARLLISRDSALTSVPITFTVQAAPNTSVVTGTLANHWTGGGVYGRVQVGAGPNVQTDAGGHYTVSLPHGSYTFTATATGYVAAVHPITVPGSPSANFVLMPDLPHLELSAAPLYSATLDFAQRYTSTITVHNAGTQPLSVTASVAPLEWALDVSGQPGAALYDVSAGQVLDLDDDEVYSQSVALGFTLPIYGQMVSEIYVSSNGWISAAPSTTAAPLANCLDSGHLPPGSLAALWADLDPSRGGVVRSLAVDEQTFVVSYEGVPPWQAEPAPDAPTYTFQIVLHASGKVDFIYGAMGVLPVRWATGAIFGSGRAHSLACYKSPVELANRVWTMHNQPAANLWLSAGSPALRVAPGDTADLPIVLRGFGYVPWLTQPFVGFVELKTNDPAQAIVRVEAQAVVGPAPYSFILPMLRR